MNYIKNKMITCKITKGFKRIKNNNEKRYGLVQTKTGLQKIPLL